MLLALALPSALLAGKSDPGAPLVAADEAFSRESGRDGNWTAARRMALPESETFAPGRVKVLEFGKDRADPPFDQSWQPDHAWISCDGTAGLTFGRWHVPGSRQRGWYESVWAQVNGGGYKLLLRRGGAQPRQLLAKPGIRGARSACSGKPGLPISAPAEGTDLKFGASRDQTLIWSSAVDRAGAVTITAAQWDGKRHVPVLIDTAPPANTPPANARPI